LKLNQASHAAWNSASINPISQTQQGGGATGVSKLSQNTLNVGLKRSMLSSYQQNGILLLSFSNMQLC
jgi:hypothetical protein